MYPCVLILDSEVFAHAQLGPQCLDFVLVHVAKAISSNTDTK